MPLQIGPRANDPVASFGAGWPGYSAPVERLPGGIPKWRLLAVLIGAVVLLSNLPKGGPDAVNADSFGGNSTGCTTQAFTLAEFSTQGYGEAWIQFHLTIANGGTLAGRWESSAGYLGGSDYWSAGASGAASLWLAQGSTGQDTNGDGVIDGTISNNYMDVHFASGSQVLRYVVQKVASYGGCFSIDHVVVTRIPVTNPQPVTPDPSAPAASQSVPPSPSGGYPSYSPGMPTPPGYCLVPDGTKGEESLTWVPCTSAPPAVTPPPTPSCWGDSPLTSTTPGLNAWVCVAMADIGGVGVGGSQQVNVKVQGYWSAYWPGHNKYYGIEYRWYDSHFALLATFATSYSGFPQDRTDAGTYVDTGQNYVAVPAGARYIAFYAVVTTGPYPVYHRNWRIWTVYQAGPSIVPSTPEPWPSADPSASPPTPSGWPSYPPLPTFAMPSFAWPPYPPFSWPSYPPFPSQGPVNICPVDSAGHSPNIEACREVTPSASPTLVGIGGPLGSVLPASSDYMARLAQKAPFGYIGQIEDQLAAAGSGGGAMDMCQSFTLGVLGSFEFCLPQEPFDWLAQWRWFGVLVVWLAGIMALWRIVRSMPGYFTGD